MMGRPAKRQANVVAMGGEGGGLKCHLSLLDLILLQPEALSNWASRSHIEVTVLGVVSHADAGVEHLRAAARDLAVDALSASPALWERPFHF